MSCYRLSVSPISTAAALGVSLLLAWSGLAFAQGAGAGPQPRPVVREATRTDTTQALRQMPQLPPMPKVLGEIFEQPIKRLPNRLGSPELDGGDPMLQEPAGGPTAPSTSAGFDGVGNENSVLPPDPVGDIGPNHYVQMVNLSFAIWDRAGTLLYGPADNKTLWQGFGGPCESRNDGDPIVLYDHLADRWLMSQFALANGLRGPFYQCIAISKTPDPTGAWHRYQFLISDTKLNDYPKFGLWPDGYYMAVNQFKCKPVGICSWAGQGVVAFERDLMLAGQSARMVYFDLANVDSNLGGMLPADLDGPVPPPGSPNPFAQIDDDAWGYSADQIQLWDFHVDWLDPASSTFSFNSAPGVAAFNSNLCGYSRNCIPQPGGTKLDSISDRLMYRLQYRNFGAYQTLVVNHTVDVNGADLAGIRWYELSDEGAGWSIVQQGSFAPDSHHRWMGSIAMNGAGQIALGYSVSSQWISPSIRFSGRLPGDPPGVMTVVDGVIASGSGYQTHSSGRWGDYSMMAVDPVDDCTFWYTAEYYLEVGVAPWRTHIGAFKLAGCGPVDNPPAITISSPASGATLSGALTVTASATDDQGVTQVEFFVDGASLGIDSAGSDGWSASWNTTAFSEGAHSLGATATDTAGQTSSTAIGVTVDNLNDAPVASFSYSCSALSCSFDASGSADPDGTIVSYDWAFGDGTTAANAGATVGHSYAAAGTYGVTVTVTDDDGATNAAIKSVTVSEAAALSVVSIAPNEMNAGTKVDVTIKGSGFANGASVGFENGEGPVPSASNVVVTDGAAITARVSVKPGGPRRDRLWDVRVTNPGGGSAVLQDGLRVHP